MRLALIIRTQQLADEERWMAAQPPTSEFALNVSMARRGSGRDGSGGLLDDERSVGATRDFMFGFAMGAVLGIIMLLWMWEAQVPRKQKLGILAGVTCKYSLEVIRRTMSAKSNGDETGSGGG